MNVSTLARGFGVKIELLCDKFHAGAPQNQNLMPVFPEKRVPVRFVPPIHRRKARAKTWGLPRSAAPLRLQATPCVKRVIDDHPMVEHFVIVAIIGREAMRDREQAVALRRQIRP